MEDKSLGAILLETTSLTEAQLEQGLAVHREKGIKLGDALVQLKFLRTEDILKALSIQLGFPYENRINTDDIPVAERPVRGHPMNNLLIDGSAQCKRISFITLERRLCPEFCAPTQRKIFQIHQRNTRSRQHCQLT